MLDAVETRELVQWLKNEAIYPCTRELRAQTGGREMGMVEYMKGKQQGTEVNGEHTERNWDWRCSPLTKGSPIESFSAWGIELWRKKRISNNGNQAKSDKKLASQTGRDTLLPRCGIQHEDKTRIKGKSQVMAQRIFQHQHVPIV
jgi:hypothetical protein